MKVSSVYALSTVTRFPRQFVMVVITAFSAAESSCWLRQHGATRVPADRAFPWHYHCSAGAILRPWTATNACQCVPIPHCLHMYALITTYRPWHVHKSDIIGALFSILRCHLNVRKPYPNCATITRSNHIQPQITSNIKPHETP